MLGRAKGRPNQASETSFPAIAGFPGNGQVIDPAMGQTSRSKCDEQEKKAGSEVSPKHLKEPADVEHRDGQKTLDH